MRLLKLTLLIIIILCITYIYRDRSDGYIKFNVVMAWPFAEVSEKTKAKLFNAVNQSLLSNEIEVLCKSIEKEIDEFGIEKYCNANQKFTSKIKLVLELKRINLNYEENVKFIIKNFFQNIFNKNFYHENRKVLYYIELISKFKYGYIVHLHWKFDASNLTVKESLSDFPDRHSINMFITEIEPTIIWVNID